MKKRVGVDVDGVVGNLPKEATRIASELLGRPINSDEMKEYDFTKLLGTQHHREFWNRLGATGMARNLEPYPGAIEGIRRLGQVADIYMVTSYLHSSPTWVHERDAWVYEHFGIPKSRMVHTQAKYTFSAMALVDDRADIVEKWAQENPHGLPVLWKQRYNEDVRFQDPSLYLRTLVTNDWEHLRDRVTLRGHDWEYVVGSTK